MRGRAARLAHATRSRVARAAARREQRGRYAALAPRFAAIYRDLAALEEESFTTPYWRAANADLAESLLPFPRRDFLRDPLIAGNMVANSPGRWLNDELAYLERRIPPFELSRRLQEDLIGRPTLIRSRLGTSHNTIHHTYHLERYREATGRAPEQFRFVVEWGGGYGNLAKLVTRAGSPGRTYLVIDNPLLVALQWLYLACTLGESAVQIVSSSETEIAVGKVNLVPTAVAAALKHIRADLFISTWALSESATAAHDFVSGVEWFGASHLLLAYQDDSDHFPRATRVAALSANSGTSRESIAFLPGNYYAFR